MNYQQINYQQMTSSPLGTIAVRANEVGITHVEFISNSILAVYSAADEMEIDLSGNAITAMGITQLNEYFAGKRQVFELPLAPQGTAFQHKIWSALQTIEFGVTCSYGDIARYINQPTASRAVGMANGKNPIAIVIPCHRVIGQNGSLTGYASGVDKKSWLLQHEHADFTLVG